jgi:lipoprotein-releasing system permease protein
MRMLSLRIAWRFLGSSRVQSILIASGIAVGIATQIFIGSIITSLQANTLNSTIGSSAHVTIKAIKESDPVRLTPEMKNLVLSDPRVKTNAVAAIRSVVALYSNGTDSASFGLIGGDLTGIDGIYDLKRRTIEGRASLGTGEIMIGKDFAEKFGLKPGDPVPLKFPNGQTGTLTVSGIFDLGAAAFNQRNAFVAGEVPQNVLGWPNDRYSQIQIQLKDPYQSKEVASAWSQQLPGVSVNEWQAQNTQILAALISQGVSGYMIQVFVLVAVALGITSTLAIAAVQKTRQIGILKAMGLADRPSGLIFLWQALILGTLGSLGGVALSFGVLWLFGLSPAPFKIEIQPKFVVISFCIGVGVAVLSSIIPIRQTSKLDPIEVIQSG